MFRVLSGVAVVLVRPRLVGFVKHHLFEVGPGHATNELSRFNSIDFRRRQGHWYRYLHVEPFRLIGRVSPNHSITPLVNATSLGLGIVFRRRVVGVGDLGGLVNGFDG